MLYLDAEATRQALPMGEAIKAMEHAFTGSAESPLRSLVGGSLVMPGRLDDTVAVKVVSVVPGSPAGLVAVFDAEGLPVGIVDGPTLTAIRTGAVCGLATRLLSQSRSSTLAMLGAGAMAADQVEAVRAVRDVSAVLVWSRSEERAADLARRIGGEAVKQANDAVSRADIVSCATPSTEPLFASGELKPGSHVNAVGAFTPEMAEIPGGALMGAFVVVDDLAAAAAEAGDLLQAGRHADADLRQVLAGTVSPLAGQTTVFKSVGIAAQDVAAASAALRNAEALGIGTGL